MDTTMKDHEVEMVKAVQTNIVRTFPLELEVNNLKYTRVLVQADGEFFITDENYEKLLQEQPKIIESPLNLLYVPTDQITALEKENATEEIWPLPFKYQLKHRILLWFQNFLFIWVIRKV